MVTFGAADPRPGAAEVAVAAVAARADHGAETGEVPADRRGLRLRGSRLPAGIVSGGLLESRERQRDSIPSGFPSLDALLPFGGIRRGSLIEWLGEPADHSGSRSGAPQEPGVAGADSPALVPPGTGTVTLACAVARGLASAATISSGAVVPRTIVVVDRTGWFHPPAVLPWFTGSAPAVQLVVARPSRDDDELWAVDQALRCPGVAAVVAWPRGIVPTASCARACRHPGGNPSDAPDSPCRLASDRRWLTAMRRWQLAARSSGAVGLIVRPRLTRGESSWAEVRLAVSPLPGGTLPERRLRLRLVGGEWAAALRGARIANGSAATSAVEIVFDLAAGREAGTHGRADSGSAGRRRGMPAGEEVTRATA